MQTTSTNSHTPMRPQNKSYPAEGGMKARATHTGGGKRGITIASPSGNTDDPRRYTVLHRGFDTLALSIQAHISAELFDFLEGEKALAEDEQREVLTEYNGLQFLIKPHGGRGFYFLLDGGPDGARWAIKKPNAKNKWGITLTFGSRFLAMKGLGAAKSHCEQVLERLGVTFSPHDISISRADVCVDILANGFTLTPENFVMHSATNRHDYIELGGDELRVSGKSGRVTSVTAGSISNRQIIIYNKRAEVIARGKAHWWDIWNDTLSKGPQRAPSPSILNKGAKSGPLTPDPAKAKDNQVWRVEFRAGKDLLKDRWGIRTWAQFFDHFGDLCHETGQVIRYCDPDPSDTNRSRWPNHALWEIACAEINDDLFEMRSGADPNPMKEVHREQHISTLLKQVTGTCITIAALEGCDTSDLTDALMTYGQRMADAAKAAPDRAAKQLQDAKERYIFIRKPTGPM